MQDREHAPAEATSPTGSHVGQTARRDDVRALYLAKARAELAIANALAAGSDVVPDAGEALAQVALVKGLPGPAEASGGTAMSGADGRAADSALSSLGYAPDAIFRLLSRPEPALPPEARAARLRYALEAVDPSVVVALDAEAAEDVWGALGLPKAAFGRAVHADGRTIVAVDGLEASLGDERRKRRVWRQMQAIRV